MVSVISQNIVIRPFKEKPSRHKIEKQAPCTKDVWFSREDASVQHVRVDVARSTANFLKLGEVLKGIFNGHAEVCEQNLNIIFERACSSEKNILRFNVSMN